ncbi:MAG: PH domain-containing protein [Jiangellaceae bacterium]|nr:PH domain-containing protein [Jiangellaceae bacterium]
MGFPQRLLGEGESVVMHMRTHAKALVPPVAVLLAVAAAVGFTFGVLPSEGSALTGRWVAAAAGAIVVIRWSLWPFLVWLTSTYTVTNERLITRQGVFNRFGRDIPLGRINDVAYQQDLLDRLFRCGSLNVSAASEHGTIVLSDVPRVHDVQRELSELVRVAHGWSPTRAHPSADQTRERADRAVDGQRGARIRDEPYDWQRDSL